MLNQRSNLSRREKHFAVLTPIGLAMTIFGVVCGIIYDGSGRVVEEWRIVGIILVVVGLPFLLWGWVLGLQHILGQGFFTKPHDNDDGRSL